MLATTAMGAQPDKLRNGTPAEAGLSPERLERAAKLIEAQVESGQVGAASLLVARHGVIALHRGFRVEPEGVFLLASITKPVTILALMLLVERGQVLLSDPASVYLPEFTGGDRDQIRVRDLATHTSGLPDMLPENVELRRRHAPLSEFVQHVVKTPLLFPPRTRFRYQSMGVLLAAEIVERQTHMRLRDFEEKEIFDPLGMSKTSLGLGGRAIPTLVPCMGSPGANPDEEKSFGANSPYWRDLGNPWGGIHSTTGNVAILLQTFLNGGIYRGTRVLSPVTAKAMTTNQNSGVADPWGYGWAVARSTAWNVFGDLVSTRTFGHAGATGTVAWADPGTGVICVVLTNRALDLDKGRLLQSVSNAVAASVVD